MVQIWRGASALQILAVFCMLVPLVFFSLPQKTEAWLTSTSTYTWKSTSLKLDATKWINAVAKLPAAGGGRGLYNSHLAVIGDYVYLFGGYASNGANSAAIFRAPVSNPTKWADTGATLPSGLADSQLAVIGNYVYLYGGHTGGVSYTTNIYRAPVSDPTSWVDTGSDIPNALTATQLAVIGDYVYIIGGLIPFSSATSTVLRAPTSDPTSFTTFFGALPFGVYGGQAAVINDFVYLFGGSTTSIYRAPTSDPTSWSQSGAYIPTSLSESSLLVFGDYVYLFGGFTANPGSQAIYRAPISDPLSWSVTSGSLPTTLRRSSPAIINGAVYLFGGIVVVSGPADSIYRVPSTLYKPPNNLGLVGYWNFHEGTGATVQDYSGNGNTGIFSSGEEPVWVQGKFGYGLDFEQTQNDHINVTSPTSLHLTGAMTICAWIKPETLATGENGIVDRENGSSNGPYSFYALNDAGTLRLVFHWTNTGGTQAQWETDASVLAVGRWQHVCGARNAAASDVQFYVDGANKSGSGDTGITPSATVSDTQIGDNIGGSWDGLIDEVRIYNRALSATEIMKLYQSGVVKLAASSAALDDGSALESGLVGHWTFDGADTAGTIADRSGRGNHGILFGAATSSAKAIGKLGQALKFSSAGTDYVRIVDSDFDFVYTAPMSISAWIYRDSSATSYIFSKSDTTASGNGYYFVLLSDGSLQYSQYEAVIPGDITAVTAAGAIANGRWYHVAATQDGSGLASGIKIYIDGASQTVTPSGSIAFQNNHTAPSVISRVAEDAASGGFNGRLDDIRIYNRAVTATEIQQLYNLGVAKVKP